MQARFPALSIYAMRGNCDPRSQLSDTLTCTVGGVRIFAAHGHQYDVKYEPELETLLDAAKMAGARVVLFGHTHHSLLEQKRDLLFLNPGTIGRVPHPGYGLRGSMTGQRGGCS